MSWAESMVAADEVIKEVRKGFMSPRAASSLSIVYDRTNMIATLSIGDSTPVYIDTYANETTETSDRAALSTTVKFEIWRRENADISSYGEGTKIATVNKNETVTTYADDLSAIADDQVFYYAVFSVGDKGNVNKVDFTKKDLNVGITIFEVYGFKQNFNDTDPSTTISYPSELVDPDDESIMYQFINAEYTPMSILVTTSPEQDSMQTGDYLSFLHDFLKNKPYMVKSSDRKADYALSEVNYSKKSDNTTSSDFSNSSYAGGPFAWVNKVYSKEIYDTINNCRYVMYSNNADTKEFGFAATGFINPSNQELEGVWIPMGYTDSNGKLCGGVTGVVSQDTATQKTTIEKLTSEAKFFGGPILNILRDMEYMLFKSTDIQAAAGYGRCNGYNATSPSEYKSKYAIPNLSLPNNYYINSLSLTLKDKYGTGFMGNISNTQRSCPGKMFHSQVLGSYNTFIRDPYTLAVNGTIKVSPNYSYDITGDSYVDTGITYTANKSGYPVKLVHTEAGSIPDLSDTSGSTSTGLCDYSNVAVSGVRVALRLGRANIDLSDGPAWINLADEASSSLAYIGVATLLLPDPGYSPE